MYVKTSAKEDLMKVVIASDVSGFRLKEAVKAALLEDGYDLTDVGQKAEEANWLFFEAAEKLARAMQSGGYAKGIVICGTGAGVSLIANKFSGIYCVACESIFTAGGIGLINNANVLAMGEKVVSHHMGYMMAKSFLDAVWCDGFEEQRRLSNEKGFEVLKSLDADR